MQLTELKLEQLLNQGSKLKLHPIYFLHGDEKFLLQKYTDKIIKIAQSQGFAEITRQTIDNSFSPDELNHLLISQSLFAPKICIILNFTQFPTDINKASIKPSINSDQTQSLIEYTKNPDPNKVLIIITKKLTKAQQKKNIITALNKTGIATAIWPPQAYNMHNWITKHAQNYNLALNNSATQLLLEQTENNLAAADQALLKLSCLTNKQISTADIQALNSHQSNYSVFELIDCALSGNLTKTKKIFAYLKEQKTESHFIIWTAIKALRTLCQIHQGLKTNKLEALYQKYQIWPKRQRIIYAAIKRLDYTQCLMLIRHAYDTELPTKGANNLLHLESWQALEIFILSIAGMDNKFLEKSRLSSNQI